MTVFTTTNSTALQILRGDIWQTSTHLQEPTVPRPAGLQLHNANQISSLDKTVNAAMAKIAAIVAGNGPGETVDLSSQNNARAAEFGKNDATFVGGNGGNSVSLGDRAYVTTGDGGDRIKMQNYGTVNAGGGNNSISTYANAKITTGDGHDRVETYGGSYVDTGDGDDYIYGYDHLTVYAGAGNDEIRAYDHAFVDAGHGDDLVITYGHSTISGGAGNDTIIVSEWSAREDQIGHANIDGGEGDDYIQTGKNSTVIGGTGNDVISLTGAGSTLIFNKGDGHDRIMSRDDFTVNLSGYGKDDVTVSIEGNDYVVTFKGSDDALTLDISSGAVARLTFEDGSTLDVGASEQYEGLQLIRAKADTSPTSSVAFYYGID